MRCFLRAFCFWIHFYPRRYCKEKNVSFETKVYLEVTTTSNYALKKIVKRFINSTDGISRSYVATLRRYFIVMLWEVRLKFCRFCYNRQHESHLDSLKCWYISYIIIAKTLITNQTLWVSRTPSFPDSTYISFGYLCWFAESMTAEI